MTHTIIYKIVVRQVRELLSKGYKYVFRRKGEKQKKVRVRVRIKVTIYWHQRNYAFSVLIRRIIKSILIWEFHYKLSLKKYKSMK